MAELAPKAFYLCPILDCNRKYKTKSKMEDHVLKVHQVADPEISDPVTITKENRKEISTKRNNDKKELQRELLIKEIETKKQQELEAKQEAEEFFRKVQIERYKLLEEQKLKQEEEFIILNQKRMKADEEYIQLLKSRAENNTIECCICADAEADTATIPCGHKAFCYSCIDEYHRKNPHKGCPMCKGEILMVSKIY
jgi:hypothetical protein